MIKMPCVILSGGKSSRMKQDKSLMKFAKYNSIIEYQYNKLQDIFLDVYISSKNNKFDSFFPIDNLILDKSDTYSPMIALESIFNFFNSKVFIITVDTPLISKETIRVIINNSKNYKITIAQSGDKTHNLCGVFDTSLLKEVNECLKKDIHKIGYLNKVVQSNIINFENKNEFININTKEDYHKAKGLL